MAGKSNANMLVIAIPRIPALSTLDFAKVTSVEAFQILNLVGSAPLFSFDTHLDNIYLKSITPSPDFRTWEVEFQDNIKFSDGSPMSASNWYYSIARTARFGAGLHFNPKEDLVGAKTPPNSKFEGLKLKDNKVILHLVQPNRSLPRCLGKPDSTVMPIRDSQEKFDLLKKHSSGPYVIKNFSDHEIIIERNPHFPGHIAGNYSIIRILQMEDEMAFKARIQGRVDFIFPKTHPGLKYEKALYSGSQVFRSIGWTTYLSYRQNVTGLWHKNLHYRRRLSQLLQEITSCTEKPGCEGQTKTSSILMGDGLGRLPKPVELSEDMPIMSLPELRLAARKTPVTEHIVEYLQKRGVRAVMCWTSDLFDSKCLNSDAILGLQDFMAKEPYMGLYTALNPTRPLFYDHNSRFRSLLESAQVTDEKEKDRIYQELHRLLILEGWVVPIFNVWIDFFADKKIDITKLVGLALWKVKPLKKGEKK